MCLDTVDKEIKQTKGFGWKLFSKGDSGARVYSKSDLLPFLQNYHNKPYPIGEWIEDDKTTSLLVGDSDERYQAGFHIFETKRGAKLTLASSTQWAVMRGVEYDDVVATGGQRWQSKWPIRTIVARKIKIMEN